MECNHTSTIKKEITRSVGRQVFKTEGTVCADCGAIRWDPDTCFDLSFKPENLRQQR